ncbi:hypothetical protein IFM89_029850 [Coptis chinensis]|uniref:tryptophan synthase n=1 Tax=Coptis chinensis TaxID=261450 RepID=A0A835HMV7_9MAGN|nr:hypothetical protein IFM89_029850 [Coptis chinensis]
MLVESLLYFAERLTEHYKGPNGEGPDIYLKREDLNHTGAHKINNVVAQALLAKRLGKKRIIAETGAVQHGVATATVCARFGLECIIYLGARGYGEASLNVLECDFSNRVACVGGGSNVMGLFHEFVDDSDVRLIVGEVLSRSPSGNGNEYVPFPSSALLGQNKDESIAALPIDDLIEKVDGFAGVFPEHKYEIVKRLQARKHICGMTGDGVNDAPALKKADIGIAIADSTDAARSASDIVPDRTGLSVIIIFVLTKRAIFGG